MKVVFSKGFPIPKTRYAGIEDIEALETEAEKRSVIVQGVRNVRMVAGKLTLEFHDPINACVACTELGFKGADNERTVDVPLRYRDGVHAAAVIGKYAYSDYEIKTR
jgi:hypothetical protein